MALQTIGPVLANGVVGYGAAVSRLPTALSAVCLYKVNKFGEESHDEVITRLADVFGPYFLVTSMARLKNAA